MAGKVVGIRNVYGSEHKKLLQTYVDRGHTVRVRESRESGLLFVSLDGHKEIPFMDAIERIKRTKL